MRLRHLTSGSPVNSGSAQSRSQSRAARTPTRALAGGSGAARGVRLLLHELLESMCALRERALDWSNIEGVHAMRVASRRLRSALQDFESYLKPGRHRRARNAVRKVADALGAVRDSDVAIVALDKLLLKAPVDVAPGIGAFLAERRGHREAERVALVQALADEQMALLRQTFGAALEAPVRTLRGRAQDLDHPRVRAGLRAAETASIRARTRELLELGRNLYRPLADRRLHRVRIGAKRLRYAIELFARHYGPALDPIGVELANLQDTLGAVHDCDVWLEEHGRVLRTHAARLAETDSGTTTPADLQRVHASLWLLRHFVKRRTRKYLDALARWQDWEAIGLFARMEPGLRNRSPARVASDGNPRPQPEPASERLRG